MTDQIITLDRIELYLLDLPQKTVFQSGIGTRKSKETLLVKWIDHDGRVGFGECSCRPDPYYSAEFLSASMQLIQRFIVPQLKGKQRFGEVISLLNKIRGWNFTKSAVESAIFQIINSPEQKDLLSSAIQSKAIEKVPVGISLGIYEDAAQMRDVVEEAIAEGYRRLKFKISPYLNTKVFDYINPLLFDNQVNVSFDANGSYSASNLERIEYFVKTYDAVIEQPTAPSRFDHCIAAKALFPELKICFDEEVKGMGDLVKLHTLNVIDELNLKIGRVGGISNSIQLLNYCHDNDIPCWIGGMFETGIGRLLNLEFASYLPDATAHDLSPSSRYFKEDIISPEIQMENGLIDVKTARAGVVQENIIEKYTTEKVVIKL